jgi:tape measure domain-containing protein
MLGLRTTVLSFAAAWAGFRVGKSIVDAGVQAQALQNKMSAATGGLNAAADAMAFVRAEALRLGLDFRTSADGFAGFSASALRAGLTLQQTKDIFSGVSEAAVSMRLSTDQTALVFKALEQIAGKGTVSMEELRGQLGDSLPGAFEIAAKAMGKTNAEFYKLVSNGEVTASEFLPRFGAAIRKELGGSAEEASRGAQAAFNRFGNALFDLKAKIASGGFLDKLTQSVQDFTATLNNQDVQNGLATCASGLASIASMAALAISKLSTLSEKAGAWAGNKIVGAFGLDQPGADLPNALKQRIAGRGFAAPGLVSGAVGSGGVAPGYSLAKPQTPGPTAAAQRASDVRSRLRDRVSEMMTGLVTENDPNKIDSAKAVADLNKRHEEEQKLLEKALEKKAITQQEYNENSLKTELDYEARMAEIRQQYREQFLSDTEAAAEGFLGIQMSQQSKSLLQQGQSFRQSISQAAQHNKTFFLLEKAAAIASALLKARESIVDAYAFGTKIGGPVLGAAFAGVAAAAQVANIAAIASTSFGDSGGAVSSAGGGASGGSADTGSASSANASPAPSKSVFITLEGDSSFSKNKVRELIEQINDALSDGSTLNVAVA